MKKSFFPPSYCDTNFTRKGIRILHCSKLSIDSPKKRSYSIFLWHSVLI